jgi:hypothetical protein
MIDILTTFANIMRCTGCQVEASDALLTLRRSQDGNTEKVTVSRELVSKAANLITLRDCILDYFEERVA